VLREQVEVKYSNKVILEVGLCVCFYDFLEVGNPFTSPISRSPFISLSHLLSGGRSLHLSLRGRRHSGGQVPNRGLQAVYWRLGWHTNFIPVCLPLSRLYLLLYVYTDTNISMRVRKHVCIHACMIDLCMYEFFDRLLCE
jgi:hypothetical protein